MSAFYFFLNILLWAVLFATYRKLDPSGIVFYQGIAITAVYSAALLLIQRDAEAIKNIIIFCLITYSINITLITTVDRAYSVKMILWLNQNAEGLTQSNIDDLFINQFIREGGVEKRISEQLRTGNIIRDEHGKYIITNKGRAFAYIFDLTRRLFSF